MKKTYRTPLLGYVKMRSVQLMDLSGTLDSSQEITRSSDFGARGGDEDFDDYE